MSNKESVKFGAKGRYSLSILDKSGKPIKDKGLSNIENAVTYEGAYDSLVSASGTSGLFSSLYAGVGTGSTETTRSSLDLSNPITTRSSASAISDREGNEVDNLDGTATITLTREMSYSLGAIVGTFSEVGVYTSASGGIFVAGQLIKDELGNPTTITVLADEQLIITYTLEWTVPNTSKIVGTGSVTDAALNTYNYEIWAQPYFGNYAIGASDKFCRYFTSNSIDEWFFRAADGTTVLGNDIDTGTGWYGRVTHNGSGTVTATTQPYTFSPTEFSAADVVFMGAYTATAGTSANNIVDTVNVSVGSVLTNSFLPAFVIKFLDPITKTSNDSFSIQVSLTVTV